MYTYKAMNLSVVGEVKGVGEEMLQLTIAQSLERANQKVGLSYNSFIEIAAYGIRTHGYRGVSKRATSSFEDGYYSTYGEGRVGRKVYATSNSVHCVGGHLAPGQFLLSFEGLEGRLYEGR